ncbi:MAG: magnesium transporter [Pedosphaera sp.]|nr:magnesium transporter [Pedosphaera sp.]
MADTTPIYLEEFKALHAADLADRLQRMPVDEARNILGELPVKHASDALTELEDDVLVTLLEDFPQAKLVPLLNEMYAEEAADVLGEMEETDRARLLRKMGAKEAKAAKELLKYPEDTAGGIMSDRFVTLRSHQTVAEGHRRIRRKHREQQPTDINYLFVTDQRQKLVGVVSIRDLIFSDDEVKVSDIMDREVKYVRVTDDQEEVVRRFERYHFLGLPVLDEEGKMAGIIRGDDVLSVAIEEQTEDMQKMVGLSGEERTLTPWATSFKRRLPWLCVNLLTACLAGAVVGVYGVTIEKFVILAVFLPIIASQGGNAGMQTVTVIVRDMALGELSPGDGRKALFKELLLGLLIGTIIGLIVGVVGYLIAPEFGIPVDISWILGLVVGTAMVLNLLAAALFGVLIPFALKFFRLDPALGSSILITTVTDVAGFFFLLALAKWILVSEA